MAGNTAIYLCESWTARNPRQPCDNETDNVSHGGSNTSTNCQSNPRNLQLLLRPQRLFKVPTKPPTVAPTPAPVKVPTKSPTIAATSAPVKVPTKPPTVAPTPAPVKVPTKSPTIAPTPAPVKVPTKSPTAPTAAPTSAPQLTAEGCCSWDYGNCKLQSHR
jgi:hypothetical protein